MALEIYVTCLKVCNLTFLMETVHTLLALNNWVKFLLSLGGSASSGAENNKQQVWTQRFKSDEMSLR